MAKICGVYLSLNFILPFESVFLSLFQLKLAVSGMILLIEGLLLS